MDVVRTAPTFPNGSELEPTLLTTLTCPAAGGLFHSEHAMRGWRNRFLAVITTE